MESANESATNAGFSINNNDQDHLDLDSHQSAEEEEEDALSHAVVDSSENEIDSSEEYDEEYDEQHLPNAAFDLFEGIRSRSTLAVKHSLRRGANVNYFRGYHNKSIPTTPLMEACEYGYDEIVRILLDAGADAWRKGSMDYSAIWYACSYGHLSII